MDSRTNQHKEAGPPASLRLVSVQRLASWWGVGASTIREWIRQGRLPAVKLGGKLLISLPDLEQIVEAGRLRKEGGS
jgi:excisionase family DNA binding protein